MREGERERRAGNNHHRHRPSAAIIRRHARLLRARYVDLLQKTLLPSFLLARSRHALFSAPPLRLMPTGCPSFIPSPYHLSTAGCHTSSSECAHARMFAHIRVSACVHIPGETLKCAAVRANTHAYPSRTEEVGNPLALPLARSLLSLSSLLPALLLSPARRLPLAHSARVRTLRDVRVCQWNTLSLSEDRREDG